MQPQATLDACLRAERGRLLAALAARTGDLQLAEDALQDAAEAALTHWYRSGTPHSPAGWLMRAAYRKAIDRLRHRRRTGAVAEALETLARDEAVPDPQPIPDDRLRLIFACCHPALEPKSQVALTLRTVCGLTTAEIARAFLDAEPAMGQRLSRAKAKIAAAGIPFSIPDREDWPQRLSAVLATAYLIFTTGYAAGPDEPRDLAAEAIFLLRLLCHLRPDEPEIEGALSMMLLTHARRLARRGVDGASVPPDRQDRRLWDADAIAEGRALLQTAFSRQRPGPFQIKAAIADCHMAEGGPDWRQIAALYDVLLRLEPTAVVALNRAVALAECGDPAQALALVEALESELSDYQPFHAARAALLARLGRHADSRIAYDAAIRLAPSPTDAAFLVRAKENLPSEGQR